MQSGDPASDEDIWLRPVTNSSHLRDGGTRVHHGEFKKWIEPPDDKSKKWNLEMSGRLLSLVTSISDDAQKKVAAQQEKLKAKGKPVPSALCFAGVVLSDVAALRKSTDLKCDVIYDPTDSDNAHANIVIYDKGAGEILTVVDSLLKALKVLNPAQAASHSDLSARA